MNLEDWGQDFVPQLKGVLPSPEEMPMINYDPKYGDRRGYKEVGQFYQCVPDSVYPWDPEIMRQIWEFAPDAVPLWIVWVFMSPSDTGRPEIEIFGRHGLGRSIKNVANPPTGFSCLMPTMPCQGITFDRPNSIWFVHEGERNTDKYVDLPGSYLPFDGSIVDRARKSAIGFNMTEKEFIEYMREVYIFGPMREHEKRRAQLLEEMDYRAKDLERYAMKQVERISDVELGEFLRSRQ